MDARLNQSDYRKFEIEVKKTIEEGNNVNGTFELEYENGSSRPSSIIVTLDINGEITEKVFINESKQ